jgi:hypothetical protein
MTTATKIPIATAAYQQFIVKMEETTAPNWGMEEFHRAIVDLDACVNRANDADWGYRAMRARNILIATAEHRWRDYPDLTTFLSKGLTMTIATKIPVDSIKIPVDYQRLCAGWAGNEYCKLRAVSSTGGLTTGTICPAGCDDNEEKWYLTIWRDLSADVCYAVRDARLVDHDDYDDLSRFEDWVDERISDLEDSYELADWSAGDDC